MIPCIVCNTSDCKTIHTAEEIRAVSVFGCYVCTEYNCTVKHTLDELKNPKPPRPEELKLALRILLAYEKLLTHGDDQASTE